MGTPWQASRQAQLWVSASSSPLPLLLLSSNFLNCKCRGKCNPILKRVSSKLERPSFQSELTCGKYLSIFHIWIYASSQLLRVWIVAQKLSKRARLDFANWTIFFMQLTDIAASFDNDILLTVACLCKPIIPCSYKRPDVNILNTSTIQRRCEHGTDCSLHVRGVGWCHFSHFARHSEYHRHWHSFRVLIVSKALCLHQTERGGGWQCGKPLHNRF